MPLLDHARLAAETVARATHASLGSADLDIIREAILTACRAAAREAAEDLRQRLRRAVLQWGDSCKEPYCRYHLGCAMARRIEGMSLEIP
jgi:hypothetical protein